MIPPVPPVGLPGALARRLGLVLSQSVSVLTEAR